MLAGSIGGRGQRGEEYDRSHSMNGRKTSDHDDGLSYIRLTTERSRDAVPATNTRFHAVPRGCTPGWEWLKLLTNKNMPVPKTSQRSVRYPRMSKPHGRTPPRYACTQSPKAEEQMPKSRLAYGMPQTQATKALRDAVTERLVGGVQPITRKVVPSVRLPAS